MNTQKGSSTIAMIAIVAVALMVGIWIGSEKDAVIAEIDAIPSSFQKISTKVKNAPEAMMEETESMVKEVMTEETEVTE